MGQHPLRHKKPHLKIFLAIPIGLISSMDKKGENMSKKEKGGNQQQGNADNVITISRCLSEDCAKKSQRAGFCNEHFAWFKAGLVTKTGEKVKDFDKKFQHFAAKAS